MYLFVRTDYPGDFSLLSTQKVLKMLCLPCTNNYDMDNIVILYGKDKQGKLLLNIKVMISKYEIVKSFMICIGTPFFPFPYLHNINH